MKRTLTSGLICLIAVLLPTVVGMFNEVKAEGQILRSLVEIAPFYAVSECPPMGQSLPPCGQKEPIRTGYPKCTNVSEGCCQYTCDYVKACDNNYYEICSTGVLERGKNCDYASGKCY